MIDLRPATIADADNLFAWRNDPVTCLNSRSTAAVSREDHDRWMKFNVVQGYPEHMVMMAGSVHGSVGVVRFDASARDLMTYDVSITIAPSHRCKGLAQPVLSEACKYMPDFTFLAEIKHHNLASRKVFERCGFEEISRAGGFLQYRKEPMT